MSFRQIPHRSLHFRKNQSEHRQFHFSPAFSPAAHIGFCIHIYCRQIHVYSSIPEPCNLHHRLAVNLALHEEYFLFDFQWKSVESYLMPLFFVLFSLLRYQASLWSSLWLMDILNEEQELLPNILLRKGLCNHSKCS